MKQLPTHKPSPTEKRAILGLALKLSWASFWATALYGTIFITPFAVVIIFAGKGLMSFACVMFFGAIVLSFWAALKSFFIESAQGANVKAFQEAVVPLVLGRMPAEDAWKNNRPALSLLWPFLRERLTAFCFGALTGSIVISAIREPAAAFLYLPLWFVADVYLLYQLLLRRLKFKHDFAAQLLDGATGFFSHKTRFDVLRFIRKAFIMPVLLAVVWWSSIPILTGALGAGPSDDVIEFMADAQDLPADKNGVYALLGIGAAAGADIHANGTEIARNLKESKPAIALSFTEPLSLACGADATALSESDRAALENYSALYAYEAFDWPRDLLEKGGIAHIDFYLKGFTSLGLLKTRALIDMALRGEREAAVQEWLRHTALLGHILKGRGSLYEFARHMESYRAAMRSLPCVLGGDAALAQKYGDGIRAAFIDISPKDLPLRKFVDNETRILGWSARRQIEVIFGDLQSRIPMVFAGIFMDIARASFRSGPGILQRKLYWLMREMRQVIDEFGGDIPMTHERLMRLEEKYSVSGGHLLLRVPDLFSPHISAIANIIIGDMPNVYDANFFDADAYDGQRILLAYAEAVRAGAWPKEMAAFLENPPDPRFKGIVTGKTFVWDAEAATICRSSADGDEKTDSHNSPEPHLCLDTKPFVE